jgi:L-lysine exporter family protein LysE/ArgO
MGIGLFLQGLSIGLAYVAPIGTQNMFVINSALTQRRRRAILTALIVIFFDITLALAGYFGIGLAIERWDIVRRIVLGVGSLLVIFIGISLLRSKEASEMKQNEDLSLPGLISRACVVTWLNPQAIIDVTLLLGSFRASLGEGGGFIFLLGVIAASFLWFLGLSLIITTFSNKFTPKVVRRINLICGIVIVFYGLKLGYDFIRLLV